jgi:hypothetical protein
METIEVIAIALVAAGLLLGLVVLLLARGPLRAGAAEAGERTAETAGEFWDWLKRGR